MPPSSAATTQASPRRHRGVTGLKPHWAWSLVLLTQSVMAQTTPAPPGKLPAVIVTHPNLVSPELGAEQILPIILEHNPQLRAAQNARDAARAGILTARALPNPRIDWTQGQNTARIASVSSGALQSWTVSQAIENPSLRQARIDAASAGELETKHWMALTRNELVSQARLRIYQGLLHQAQAAAAAEDVQLLEQVRERVRLRVESGEAARYEIIKADA